MKTNTNTNLDKLITFGQMALEQGWYEQARDYFEQALALDATNREAMKGLARANEILSRKVATVRPTPAKPAKPPREVERKRSEPERKTEVQATTEEEPGEARKKLPWVLIIMIFLLVLVVGTVTIGLPALQTYQARQRLDSYLEQAQPLLDEFSDTLDIAESTPRMSLPPIVSDLQKIQREFRQLEPPFVADSIHKYYSEGMDLSIRAFLAFMAQENDAEVSRLFTRATDAFNNGFLAIFEAQTKVQ